jgi:mono/diheme cytochrome c family protein
MNENQNWVDDIPKEIEVNERFMLRGQERFEVYCAPCHGMAGYGDGLVNRRALSLKAPTWVPVPSLHTPQTRNRADGYIFRAITEGVRKMPAYGSQILPEDRWAIVLYVRALQRSQGAAPK